MKYKPGDILRHRKNNTLHLTTEFGDSSMEYKCATCKFCVDANEVKDCGWAGNICTRIVILAESKTDIMVYLVAAGEAPKDVRMIVPKDHLCVLWEAKE